MTAPATVRDALLRHLEGLARQGRPMPSLRDVALAIDTSQHWASTLLGELRAAGVLVVVYGRNGIAAIEAADGSWRLHRGRERPPTRHCLRCQRMFQPSHRHNFLCGCPEAGRLEPRGVNAPRQRSAAGRPG